MKSSDIEYILSFLIKETQAGNIKWELSKIPSSLGQATDDIYSLFLTTKTEVGQFGLYKKKYKYYYDYLEYSWQETEGLCVLDNLQGEYIVLYQYEKFSPALSALFDIARWQTANLDEIVKKIRK